MVKNDLLERICKAKTLTTHNGDFHADETIACAMILELNPGLHITRNRDALDADILVDCGFKYDVDTLRFDHHQKGGAGERENGVPYASAGLVWKDLGYLLIGGNGTREAIQIVDEKMIQWVDATDNGIGCPMSQPKAYTLFDVLRSYGSDTADPKVKMIEFLNATSLARQLLRNEMYIAKQEVVGRQQARLAFTNTQLENGTVKITTVPSDKYWQHVSVLEQPDAKIVIYKRPDDAYAARAVPTHVDGFIPRVAFPESWRGLSGADLVHASQVADATFCHNKGFIACAKSHTGAYQLAQKALSIQK